MNQDFCIWTQTHSQFECNFICSTTLNTFHIMYSCFYSIFISKNKISSFIPNYAWSAQLCTFYKWRSILRFVWYIYYKHHRHQCFFFILLHFNSSSCDVVLFFVSLKSHMNLKTILLFEQKIFASSFTLFNQTNRSFQYINAKLVHFIHVFVLHSFLVYFSMWFFLLLLLLWIAFICVFCWMLLYAWHTYTFEIYE